MADTVKSLLAAARARLREADVGGESLDARLLLQQATGFTHAELIADPDRPIEAPAKASFEAFLRRRLAFEPVSRILGEREFFGRNFEVTPQVLDPRPDTETLIEEVLPLLRPGSRVLDLGAGSGAIIVTLLAECPECFGVAVDLSPEALAVTARNAARHEVAEWLATLESNWFEKVSGRFDLIVSNPPYIPAGDVAGLEPDVRIHDPHLALVGGDDGLAAYRQIAAGAADHLAPGGRVAVEIGAGQSEDVVRIFAAADFHLVSQRQDLGGHLRALGFSLS